VIRVVVTVLVSLLSSGFLSQRHKRLSPAPLRFQRAEVTPTPLPTRSIVYRTGSSDAIYDYKVNVFRGPAHGGRGGYQRYRQPTVAAAWASLVKPSDIVGIKVCANGAPLFSTHPEVVETIIDGLRQAGVPPENIVVWDREAKLLKRAGFHFHRGSYRVMWNEDNYDPQVALSSPVTGPPDLR